MEDLALINKLSWKTNDSMDYIQTLQKEQCDHGQKMIILKKKT
jgi:hypothetical protein